MAQVKKESTFKQTFRRGYEARKSRRVDKYAYKSFLPDSTSSDTSSSQDDSDLSEEVEELMQKVEEFALSER